MYSTVGAQIYWFEKYIEKFFLQPLGAIFELLYPSSLSSLNCHKSLFLWAVRLPVSLIIASNLPALYQFPTCLMSSKPSISYDEITEPNRGAELLLGKWGTYSALYLKYIDFILYEIQRGQENLKLLYTIRLYQYSCISWAY